MAGRQPPGPGERDRRWLVDRQIYERRADGARYITWTRGRQLTFAWLIAVAVGLAAVAGGTGVWAWQRFAPDLAGLARVVVPPPAGEPDPAMGPLEQRLADAEARNAKLAAELAEVRAAAAEARDGAELRADHDIEALQDRVRDAEAAQGQLGRELREAQVRAEALQSELKSAREPTAAADQKSAKTAEGIAPELEVTLLRHERDAAREQIDALMQLSAQLKEDLARAEATKGASVAAAAGGEPGKLADVATELRRSEGREMLLAASMERLRAELDQQLDGLRRERDQAVASVAELEASHRQLTAGNAELAGRLAEAERLAATREAEARQARQQIEAAAAREAALSAGELEARSALDAATSELEVRAEASRVLEASVAALEGQLGGVRADLERVKAERQGLAQTLDTTRTERDTALARLQAVEPGAGEMGDVGRVDAAERDRLAARVDELLREQGELRLERDRLSGELAGLGLQGELSGTRATRAALEDKVATSLARIKELEQAAPADGVIPATSWAGTSAAAATGGNASLSDELATALARVKELDGRVVESERRFRDLESFLARFAPPPPPAAPR